ncbi:EAL and HDOD domain-containing protein [Oceanidesulfovibrio marinus]|uniref:Diguanylate phosphodiesterase n=1 Tax=Oceanidesulfovibrio marinus TaxID=370038 RepID=A0A6P1ZHB6_9BACT|nr:HDOD domain-containing protein [Oceanidesulfovibrio marinus]QJT08525.1 HDOD domain-containing protein [Oceanidesulfovibrio marinus]TVM33007.1 diguanylate phosphodiesterase [Oceanidesulfovibrio marinus]
MARQPICDDSRQPWGYKLYFRNSQDAQSAEIEDPNKATANLIADGYALAHQGIDPTKKVVLSVPLSMVRKSMVEAFPPERVIPQLERLGTPNHTTVAAVQELKKAGYDVAVSLPCYDSLLQIADIIILDILGHQKTQIAALVQKLSRYPGRLLALKVEDQPQFEMARSLGFELFQGNFFSKPVLFPGRKISLAASAKLKLIQELSKEDFEVAALARTVSSDPSLSYRLLKFINSVAFSLPHKIQSIQQAITLLGQKQLRQWLMAVSLSDLDTSFASEEHYFTSIQRARFLELLAEAMPKPPLPKETMSLIGLFSMLDVLLGQTMSEIMEQFPLDEHVAGALTGEDPSTSQWIRLTRAVENGEWAKVGTFLEKHGLGLTQAAVSYNMATLWASEILESAE